MSDILLQGGPPKRLGDELALDSRISRRLAVADLASRAGKNIEIYFYINFVYMARMPGVAP